MKEFFKPWRRKLGVVTLGVACVFMGLWIRGHEVTDLYQFGSGQGTTFQYVVLSQHGIMWVRSDVFGDSTLGWDPGWKNLAPSTTLYNEGIKVRKASDIKWRWSWCGFDFCHISDDADYRYSQQNIPYWPIVIPPTLLSAYLLLSKPRPTTAMKTREPAPAEVS